MLRKCYTDAYLGNGFTLSLEGCFHLLQELSTQQAKVTAGGRFEVSGFKIKF